MTFLEKTDDEEEGKRVRLLFAWEFKGKSPWTAYIGTTS